MGRAKRIEPGPGQESVWDYPRPPRLEATSKRIRIVLNGVTIADTRQAQRVLETSHPPVYYLPPDDIAREYLRPARGSSFCEWKGEASYYAQAAWTYRHPSPAFAAIADYIAIYPGKMDECYVDDERVQAQPSDFYGGWITGDIVGPFKGDPGTWGW
jgi:uncharacterized protein (DUF427 family)